jgi:hypothetical protein
MEGIKRTAITNALLASVFGVGVLFLLNLALRRGILSPREEGIGMLAWAVSLCVLVMFLGKRAAREYRLVHGEYGTTIDDITRKRRLRSIQIMKVWIGILAVLLPIGIVNGIVHRAWLPTLSGVGMNLLFMYVARESIRRLRKSLNVEPPMKT